jgi:exodeoxyribonuclease VII large subunit
MARKKKKESAFDIPLFDVARVGEAEERAAPSPYPLPSRERGEEETATKEVKEKEETASPSSAGGFIRKSKSSNRRRNNNRTGQSPVPTQKEENSDNNNGTRSRPLTVSELASGVGEVLDSCFPDVWVVGQVSGLRRAESGHLYFDLKDAGAALACVMWREQAARLAVKVTDGLEVIARGRVGFYPKTGRCQFYVTHLELKGVGALELKFRQLKERLEKEGLFAPERKKPLPGFPLVVGVVTSPTGAAIRDIFNILGRRAPWLRVLLYPVAVQGEAAAGEIARAIRDFDRCLADEVDVLIVGRGGGSAEDLWAFNEEVVARAIAACRIPIISAVGHETDFSISDFVADVRAPTPSAAAEIVAPDRRELLQRVETEAKRLRRVVEHEAMTAAHRWQRVAEHRFFKYPEEIAGLRAAAVDELDARLKTAARRLVDNQRRALHDLERRLLGARPEARLAAQAGRLEAAAVRHEAALQRIVERASSQVQELGRRLEALGPLAVLERGYSITISQRSGRPVRAAGEVAAGDVLETTVSNREKVRSRVEN